VTGSDLYLHCFVQYIHGDWWSYFFCRGGVASWLRPTATSVRMKHQNTVMKYCGISSHFAADRRRRVHAAVTQLLLQTWVLRWRKHGSDSLVQAAYNVDVSTENDTWLRLLAEIFNKLSSLFSAVEVMNAPLSVQDNGGCLRRRRVKRSLYTRTVNCPTEQRTFAADRLTRVIYRPEL